MNRTSSQTNTLRMGNGRAFYFLATLVALAFAAYLFLIGQTVFKLVAEKNITAENRGLSAEISQLELAALSLNDTISIEKAYELGFVDATDTQYVASRGELTLR